MLPALYPSARPACGAPSRRGSPPAVRTARSLLLGAAVALAACDKAPRIEQAATPAPVALPAGGTARADALMQSAADRQGQDPQAAARLRLEAGDLYAREGQLDRLEQCLALLSDASLDDNGAALRSALRAQAALLRNNPLAAISVLAEPSPAWPASTNAQLQSVYAQALFGLGDAGAAVQALVERETWLSGQAALDDNHARIWTGLLEAPLGSGLLDTRDDLRSVTIGWLQLARIARSAWVDNAALDAAWNAWWARHAPHPAQPTYTSQAQQLAARGSQLPAHIALLLPQSGRLATAGGAVRDGFMAAWLQSGSAPRVQVYDTESADLDVLVGRALADGAEIIVGPLTKERVESMSRLDTGPVPVLALNQLDERPVYGEPTPALSPAGLYQFALSPEDEARQVADHASTVGAGRAIALFPDNDAGRRTMDAFRVRLAELGGTTLDARPFADDTNDFSEALRSMLHIQASRDRAREVARALGSQPKFQPRRRADVDVVFAPVRAAEARQIRPQLKFHFAGDLPVLATSRVNDDTGGSAADIEGIRFVDMPWMLASGDPSLDQLRQPIRRLWPARADRLGRLYAFGVDAYRLLPLIGAGPVAGGQFIPAATGDLFVQPDRRIGRSLMWAQFQGGEVVLVQDNPATEE